MLETECAIVCLHKRNHKRNLVDLDFSGCSDGRNSYANRAAAPKLKRVLTSELSLEMKTLELDLGLVEFD